MRRVELDELDVNQKLGKTICDENGRVLLRFGTMLTLSFMDKLKAMGITSVYVEDGISEGIETEDMLSEKTTQEAKDSVKNMVNRFSVSGTANYQGVIKSTGAIIDEILENKNIMMSVTDIRTKDEILFSHSISVCSLATTTALKLGYNVSKLKDIAVGALLHDIGKVKIIKDKKLKHSDFQKLDEDVKKSHPKVGYDMLGDNVEIGSVSKVIALLHHENFDGSGFPMGLANDKIHETARIVAICNAFDNMVTGNSSFGDIPVYQIVEYLTNSSDKFDPNIAKVFVENLAIYPNGTTVELSDKSKGIVVRQNYGLPTRPRVRVLVNKDGSNLKEPYEIGLEEQLSLFITKTAKIGE